MHKKNPFTEEEEDVEQQLCERGHSLSHSSLGLLNQILQKNWDGWMDGCNLIFILLLSFFLSPPHFPPSSSLLTDLGKQLNGPGLRVHEAVFVLVFYALGSDGIAFFCKRSGKEVVPAAAASMRFGSLSFFLPCVYTTFSSSFTLEKNLEREKKKKKEKREEEEES